MLMQRNVKLVHLTQFVEILENSNVFIDFAKFVGAIFYARKAKYDY